MSHDRGCFRCGRERYEYHRCYDTDCPKQIAEKQKTKMTKNSTDRHKKPMEEKKDDYTFDPTEVAQTFLRNPLKVIPVQFRSPSESQKDNAHFAINTGTGGIRPVVVFMENGGYSMTLARDIFGRAEAGQESIFDIGVPCEVTFP